MLAEPEVLVRYPKSVGGLASVSSSDSLRQSLTKKLLQAKMNCLGHSQAHSSLD